MSLSDSVSESSSHSSDIELGTLGYVQKIFLLLDGIEVRHAPSIVKVYTSFLL